jgi:hypothetical protein
MRERTAADAAASSSGRNEMLMDSNLQSHQNPETQQSHSPYSSLPTIERTSLSASAIANELVISSNASKKPDVAFAAQHCKQHFRTSTTETTASSLLDAQILPKSAGFTRKALVSSSILSLFQIADARIARSRPCSI